MRQHVVRRHVYGARRVKAPQDQAAILDFNVCQLIPDALDAARQGVVVGQLPSQAQTLFADGPIARATQRKADGALAEAAVPRTQFRRRSAIAIVDSVTIINLPEALTASW